MGRPRKPISPSGFLRCSRCKNIRHISDFYIQNAKAVWFTDKRGTIWGKPSSWCKLCMRQVYHPMGAAAIGDTPQSLERDAMDLDLEPDDGLFVGKPPGALLGPPESLPESTKPDSWPDGWKEVTDEEIAQLNRRPDSM